MLRRTSSYIHWNSNYTCFPPTLRLHTHPHRTHTMTASFLRIVADCCWLLLFFLAFTLICGVVSYDEYSSIHTNTRNTHVQVNALVQVDWRNARTITFALPLSGDVSGEESASDDGDRGGSVCGVKRFSSIAILWSLLPFSGTDGDILSGEVAIDEEVVFCSL